MGILLDIYMLYLTRELDYYHAKITPMIGDTNPFGDFNTNFNPNPSLNLHQFSQLTITDDEEEEDPPIFYTQPETSSNSGRPTDDPINEREYYGSEGYDFYDQYDQDPNLSPSHEPMNFEW